MTIKSTTFITLFFFGILFSNCKNENKDTETVKTKHTKSESTIAKKQGSKIVDEDFETFLNNFSHDSIFQISRVKFPLKITEINEEDWEGGSIHKTISKSEYTKLDFTYPKDALTREFDRYSQKNKLKGNLMTVEIRGIDNGIYSDFTFEKIDGKWFLKTWNEAST